MDAVVPDTDAPFKVTPRRLLDAHMKYFDMSTNPRIELGLGTIRNGKITPSAIYVWVLLLVDKAQGREGISQRVARYPYYQEAQRKFKEWMARQEKQHLYKAYEALSCYLTDLDEYEAMDAISVALARYFMGPDEKPMEGYEVKRDIDLQIIMPWPRQRTVYLTLHPDHTITEIR